MSSENLTNNGGKSIRLFRPSIVVLCGPAACGKSTFAQRHFRPTQIISSDWARALICDDERDQRFNTQAFALLHFLLEQRLTVNRLCVVDSTALTAQARKDLLDLARRCHVPATLILFHVPLETCLERDAKRERSVGRTIIERQCQALEQAQATIRQEGFDQVVELQDGDLDKVQIEILFRPVQQRTQRPEAGPPRHVERAGPPSGRRPSGPHDATPPVALPPTARPAELPRPAAAAVPLSTPQEATARAGDAPAPLAGKPPAPAAASAASALKPGSPSPVAAPSKPAPTAGPRAVQAEAKPSGGS